MHAPEWMAYSPTKTTKEVAGSIAAHNKHKSALTCLCIRSGYFYVVFDNRFGVVVGMLAYNARGRGFDSPIVQTFVCMNMSVCIGSGCFYV
jgi:hypothetical protein